MDSTTAVYGQWQRGQSSCLGHRCSQVLDAPWHCFAALMGSCVYIHVPTEGSGIATIDDSYSLLRKILTFKQKGKIDLLGDFNARVGKSNEVDDVIGMFGEGACNASGNELISFLSWLFAMKGRTRVSLKQKSIIRKSVDSLCRDGANTPLLGVHTKPF